MDLSTSTYRLQLFSCVDVAEFYGRLKVKFSCILRAAKDPLYRLQFLVVINQYISLVFGAQYLA